MTPKTAVPRTLVLLVVALGLGVLDAVAISNDRRHEAEHTGLAGSLLTFSPNAVHKVTLTRAGKTPLVLEKIQQSWVVSSHKNYPARASRIEAALARLAGWKRERIAGDKSSQLKFGVTPETALTVRLDDASGRPIGELAMGTLTGVDSEAARGNSGHVDPNAIGRCVRVLPEDPIYVVHDFVTGELEPDPNEWLERPTGGTDDSKVRALSVLQRLGENVAIHFDPADPRLGDGRPIDLEKAHPLARGLVGLNASDVAANEDDPRLGLGAPRASIEVALEGAPTGTRLIVGDEISGTSSASYPGFSPPATEKWGPLVAVKISGRPTAVLVPAGSLEPYLNLKSESLVLTHALAPRVEGVTRLEVTHDGKTIVLAQDNPSWTVTLVAPGATPHKLEGDAAQALKTRAIAAATTGLAISGFDRPASPLAGVAHGLISPQVKIVYEAGRTIHRELTIAAPEGERAWAKRSDDPCELALSASAVAELINAFDALPTN